MKLFKKWIILAGALLVVGAWPVLAQEATEAPTAAPEPIAINISMTDYLFSIEGVKDGEPLQLKTGQTYQITFTNDSEMKMGHEVLFGRNANVVDDGKAHLDYAEPLLADVETELSGDGWVVGATGLNEFEVAYGKEVTVEFTLPAEKAGKWEIGCFEFLNASSTDENPGETHYDDGMFVPVVVTAAS